MLIGVKTLTGKIINLCIDNDTNIQTIKNKIEKTSFVDEIAA